MTEQQIWLADETATLALGERLGGLMSALPGGTIFLEGDLGAGKTTFTRGVLQSFGHTGAVKSPTYTLVEGYEFAQRTVYHFDLYRLGDPEELEYMGIRDYFGETRWCLLEWPGRGAGFLPVPDLVLALVVHEGGRLVKLEAHTPGGEVLLAALEADARAQL